MYQYAFLPTVHEVPFSPHLCQHLLFCVFLILPILIDVKYYLIVALICISLMISHEHLFIYLPSVYLFLEKCLFTFLFLLAFLGGEYWVIGVVYIFWILTPIGQIICKYILPFYTLPFSFIDGLLRCAEAFYFVVVPPIYFCFCFSCFRRQI